MTGGTISSASDGSDGDVEESEFLRYGPGSEVFSAWGDRIAALPAGPELDAALAERPNRVVDGVPAGDEVWARVLLDSKVHRQRVTAYLAAQDAADLVGFAGCYPALADAEYMITELAMALRFSEASIGARLDRAQRLVNTLPRTWEALNAGTIHVVHAMVITAAVENTTPEVAAAAAEEHALKRADRLAPGELARRCRDKVLRLDPDAARKRNVAAVADRSVTVCALNDGMAQMRMIADAPDVAAAYAAIGELAKAAKTPGDDRDAGNRRCDVLLDLCLAAVGMDPRPHPAGNNPDGFPDVDHDDPGDSADPGDGPTASPLAGSRIPPALAGTAVVAKPRVVTGESGSGRGRPAPGTPARPTGTTICDPEASSGAGPGQPESGGSGTGEPSAELDSAAAADTPTASAASTTPTSPAPPKRPTTSPPRALVHVTVPYSVLLGSDDPCYLSGIGPISADQARLIAGDGILQRILTDPATGAVLDVGRTKYRPPAHLADHVRARDLTCVAPGCGKPARDCDLDHRVPFHPGQDTGGSTSVDNIAPLCRHHHRAKDQGKHRLDRLADGTYQWTTPLGRRYLKIHAELEPPPPPPPAPVEPTTPEEPPF